MTATSSAFRFYVLSAMAVLVCMLLLSTAATASIVSEKNTVLVILGSSTKVFLDSPVEGEANQPSIASLFQALQKQTTSNYINSEADVVKRVIMIAYDELTLDDFNNHYTHFSYLLPALSSVVSSMMFQTAPFVSEVDQLYPLFATHINVDCKNEVAECESRLAALRKEEITQQLVVIRVTLDTRASALSSILPLSSDPSTVVLITSAHPHAEIKHFIQQSLRVDADPPVHPPVNPDAAGSYFIPVYELYYNTTDSLGDPIKVAVWLGPQYITPNIFFGLLLGLFLIFMLYQAIYCMTSIQRPVRLSAQSLVIAKEY